VDSVFSVVNALFLPLFGLKKHSLTVRCKTGTLSIARDYKAQYN